MTESEFWLFLELSRAGRQIPVVSGYVDSNDESVQKAGKYIGGHSVLFKGHDKLPINVIHDMGGLLLARQTSHKAKEAILIILAHHPTVEALDILKRYNQNPDPALKYMAYFALDECLMWNE
ncbi:MAG: hypothetical protein ISS92_03575 [Candidatus Omnitrophica bacterium]|nr:hypothetical protein [Candidatus Omnitrophota bacterium]